MRAGGHRPCTRAASTSNASANNAVGAYWAHATPINVGSTGQRSFATDTRGTVFQDTTGAVFANPVPAASQPIQ